MALVRAAFDDRTRVATVELTRPQRRNALDLATIRELRDALTEAVSRTHAIVVTGSGSAFCAGADLSGLPPSDGTAEQRETRLAQLQEISAALSQVQAILTDDSVVSFAAINGPAVGGGWALALACDVQVAVPEARFWFPEAGMGRAVGEPSVRLAVRVLGQAVASRAVLMGTRFTARELRSFGVLTDVVTPEALPGTVAGLAAHAAALGNDVVTLAKSRIRSASTDPPR
ncbi:MAG TPA: enoyl-CoA hydratase/isomerase family protein [Pseudonocardia sp.]|jgi:enoyl-CoA hydratase/carnithine racemase|nr:enoyl-CoA hydratase/isomerase family protein [Pseudonocardia sp.]